MVLWSLNPTKDLVTLIGHDAAVNTLKFTPDKKILATGGDDNQILLWNVKNSLLLDGEVEPIRLLGHKGKIVDLEFSNDGETLYSACWDGCIGVWSIKDKKNIDYFLSDSPIFEIIKKDEIESLLKEGNCENSYNKFLFNFLNSKIFIEKFL